jgi:hypothetical protein
MNPESLQDQIYYILDTLCSQAKTWNGKDRSDKQLTQDRYFAAQALLKLIEEVHKDEMKQLYMLLNQWTEERKKDADPCNRQIFESDVWVVMKFLNYVWAEKEKE